MKYCHLVFLFTGLLVSCDNPYDAERLAERYCHCMESNKATEDFNKATDICVNKFISENKYFKSWYLEMRVYEPGKYVLNDTRDSVKLFFDRFTEYTKANCCKEVLMCSE